MRFMAIRAFNKISFIVSGWFCEVRGGGEKGATRRLLPRGSGGQASPEICENRCNISK